MLKKLTLLLVALIVLNIGNIQAFDEEDNFDQQEQLVKKQQKFYKEKLKFKKKQLEAEHKVAKAFKKVAQAERELLEAQQDEDISSNAQVQDEEHMIAPKKVKLKERTTSKVEDLNIPVIAVTVEEDE